MSGLRSTVNRSPDAIFHNGIIAPRVAAVSRSRVEAGLPVRAAQPLRAAPPASTIETPCRQSGHISPAVCRSSLFVFAHGTRAAEPHIRSPRPRQSPKSLMLEVSGSETGPIFMTASRSQNVIRSVHRSPPGQAVPRRSLVTSAVGRHADFNIAPAGISPWVR
jgi:hypothetical protein